MFEYLMFENKNVTLIQFVKVLEETKHLSLSSNFIISSIHNFLVNIIIYLIMLYENIFCRSKYRS